MEQLLERAKELVQELQVKIQQNDKRKADLDRKEAELTGYNNQLEQLAAQLASREEAVKKVESLQDLYTSAKKAKSDADVERNKLAGEKDAYRQEVANTKQELALERQKVAEARAAQRKEYEELRAAQAKLAEDRKSLKGQILKEIGSKIGV